MDDGHVLGIIPTVFARLFGCDRFGRVGLDRFSRVGFDRCSRVGFDRCSRVGLFGLVEGFIIDAKGFIQGVNTSAMICVPEGGLKYL